MPSEADVALAFVLVASFAAAVLVLLLECLQSVCPPAHADEGTAVAMRDACRRRECVRSLLTNAFIFQPYDEPQSCRECAICLDPIHKGTSVIRLECEHAFHSRCIARWLLEDQYEPACPTCKADPFPWPTWTCCFCCRVRLPFDELPLSSFASQLLMPFSMADANDELLPGRDSQRHDRSHVSVIV